MARRQADGGLAFPTKSEAGSPADLQTANHALARNGNQELLDAKDHELKATKNRVSGRFEFQQTSYYSTDVLRIRSRPSCLTSFSQRKQRAAKAIYAHRAPLHSSASLFASSSTLEVMGAR